jgi:RNA polymerase sigma-70 factor (ECF subfamily)
MNQAGDEADQQDMGRLVQGHDAALDDLMERHGQRLFAYLLRQLSESEAEDCAQETFVRIYLNRAKFRPGAKFSTWLYTIATNLARDCQRRNTRHPQISMEAASDREGGGSTLRETMADGGATPAEALMAGERAGQVRQAVQALPEELREALLLYEYENLSQGEIGEILHCTPKAVETRIYRARNLLRQSLAGLLGAG